MRDGGYPRSPAAGNNKQNRNAQPSSNSEARRDRRQNTETLKMPEPHLGTLSIPAAGVKRTFEMLKAMVPAVANRQQRAAEPVDICKRACSAQWTRPVAEAEPVNHHS